MANIDRNDIERVKEIAPEVYDFLLDKSRCNESAPNGRIDITEDCYAIVSGYETASRDNKEYESHRKYIDVQMLIAGEEYIEIAPIDKLRVSKEYSAEKDVMFFSNDVAGDNLVLEPGKAVILMPDCGHMPGVACNEPKTVKKVVVKIPVKRAKKEE